MKNPRAMYCCLSPLLLILTILIVSCGKGSSDNVEMQKQAITEHDIAAGRAVSMNYGNTVAMFMEPSDARTTSHSDTGTIGTDIIPIIIEQSGTYTFSLEDDEIDRTVSRVEMISMSDRAKIFELNSTNRAVTLFIPAGRYEYILHSAYDISASKGADHRVVFLKPDQPNKVSEGIKNSPTKMSLSMSCIGCDLNKANLRDANLANTNLSKADLSGADMTGANTEGANLLGANVNAVVWSTGVVGSAVTLINNCSIEVWAGISGNTAVKSCKSNDDCGGGICDLTTARPTCKQIYCGDNSDCPVNSFCGGVTSYAGSCVGSSANECGTNRFCDTSNKNYFPDSGPTFNNPCSNDSACSGYDPKARCDMDQKRCFIYQCGWKTCYYVPLPVKDINSSTSCSSNSDCAGKVKTAKSSAIGKFCYVTNSNKGLCAQVNTEGNGLQMTAKGATQTYQVPRTWGGRFWGRTECSEQCSKCPDAFCQTNSDCPSGRTCLTTATPTKSAYCSVDSQCKPYERCDGSNALIESPVCQNNNWIDQCQTDNDCNSNSTYTGKGFKNMKCLTRTDLGCGGQIKPVNVCVFSLCSSYKCTDSNNCNCNFQCSTGGCIGFDGRTFSKNCIVSGADSPTLAELFMDTFGNSDFYDVSMVDGANISVRISPDPNSYNLNTLNGIDITTSCSTDSDCWGKKKSPNWVCASTGTHKGYCVNKFQCSSPGCISNDDCDKYGLGSFLSGTSKLLPSPWGGGDFAVSEQACKDALKLKVNGKYVGCLSPRDACKTTNPSPSLNCNQSINGQGTYLNLYSCDGANSGSCYTDGADSSCCGCPDWLPKTFCINSNPTWVASALPYYKVFHSASPTAYSFPYDDKNSTFTCVGKSSDVNVNYTVTFCPGN